MNEERLSKEIRRLTNSPSMAAIRATATPQAGVFVLYARKSTEGEDRQIQSIDDQVRHCQAFADAQNLAISHSIAEAHSAKRHATRPGFREMIDRIEAGGADGILAWHPDRLARNAIDGGWILDLLDRGKLRHLRFASYTFENTPEGKMMLGMIFSQAKYQVDKLSVDVRRGMDTKREQGWFPHRAGEGYKNELETHTIIADPARFPLLRQAIELILAGTHRPSEALRVLNDDWGYRTRLTKHSGGGPLSRNGFYRILSNPFYYGECQERGIRYPGAHQPLISRAESRQIQARLANTGKHKPKLHSHPFTGLMRCGHCGSVVTASRAKGHVYYHCTDRLGICNKACLRSERLEDQFLAYFDRLSIPAWLEPELVTVVCRHLAEEPDRVETAETGRQAALDAAQKHLQSLTGMRMRELLTDAEYFVERTRLQDEIEGLERAAWMEERETAQRKETMTQVASYAVSSRQAFLDAEPTEQRRLAGLLGEKLLLTDRQLSLEMNPYLSLLTEHHDALLALEEMEPGQENQASKRVQEERSTDTDRVVVKPGENGFRSQKTAIQAAPVPSGCPEGVQTVETGYESTKKASLAETVFAGAPSEATFKLIEAVGASLAELIQENRAEFSSGEHGKSIFA